LSEDSDAFRLEIDCPKRNSKLQVGWEAFFPYYAGYPEAFATKILQSAKLAPTAVVLDPWNGSGTTTHTASQLGLSSVGCDLNPVMIIVAKSRLLPASEADSIEPHTRDVLSETQGGAEIDPADPLLSWFYPATAATLRAIEAGIRRHLLGSMTLTPTGPNLNYVSSMAATFYVALFSVCRELASSFRSSNPTWFRIPKPEEKRIRVARDRITQLFEAKLRSMTLALLAARKAMRIDLAVADLRLLDTASDKLDTDTVDFFLTSPPYCTRIDYAAATRVELAVMVPLLLSTTKQLSRRMLGSTSVPAQKIEPKQAWGATSLEFLEKLQAHSSKASAGYYFKTHADYFDKLHRSLTNVVAALKPGSTAVFVAQDSYYKELHNDLPMVIQEMGQVAGLSLTRVEPFRLGRSMSGINRYSRSYKRPHGAVEAVICFRKLERQV
jgi:DNA modification methylase